VADLIELCFAHEMDDGGRGFIRELRFLSLFGQLLPLVIPLGLGREIWTQGVVWVERGRVVGSINTQPAGPRSATWLIANVAVHPDQRRRGIALQMMRATLDQIRQRGGADVILQVDDDNAAAIELYRRLGFQTVATHLTWTRPGRAVTPPHAPASFDIRPRAEREWLAELNLAELVRPEGLAWNRPPARGDFRPDWRRRLGQLLHGQVEEHWLALTPDDRVAGAVILMAGLADGDRLTLLAHPAYHGQVERPLLVRGLRRLGARPGPVRLEHPAGDPAAEAALRDLGFTVARALRWLKKELH
jgi:GNAT superfamily N-acetyltransferase